MDSKSIIKWARVLNWMEVAATLILFVVFSYINFAVKNMEYDLSALTRLASLMRLQNATRIASGVISVVVIIAAAVLMSKNTEKIKGLPLILASGILSLVFAILALVIGIVVWILVGASMNQLKKSEKELAAQAEADANQNIFGQPAETDNIFNAQAGTFEDNKIQ